MEQAVYHVLIVIKLKQKSLVDNARIHIIKMITMSVNYVPKQYSVVKSVITIVKILQI